jgi:hypothetical protein
MFRRLARHPSLGKWGFINMLKTLERLANLVNYLLIPYI